MIQFEFDCYNHELFFTALDAWNASQTIVMATCILVTAEENANMLIATPKNTALVTSGLDLATTGCQWISSLGVSVITNSSIAPARNPEGASVTKTAPNHVLTYTKNSSHPLSCRPAILCQPLVHIITFKQRKTHERI